MAGGPAVSRGGGIALLERPELERRLDELFAKRLGLVVADAGYGKTTLVAGWTRELSSAWHTVDPLDRELSRFIQSLAPAFDESGTGNSERAGRSERQRV